MAQYERLERDEVTAGMGLILAGLINAIDLKAAEINAQRDPDIVLAADELQERVMIIGYGLRKKPRQKKLHDFDGRIKETYGFSVDAIQRYADDRYRLVDMALKIGIAIHKDAVENGLLTEKAMTQLKKFEN